MKKYPGKSNNTEDLNKSNGIKILSRLSGVFSDYILDMLNVYKANGTSELTESQVLKYLHDKLNIL